MHPLTAWDGLGLVGVVLILVAYALSVLGRLDTRGAPSLAINFVGASLILASLWRDFNLSAALIEAAWAVIALLGLIGRLAKRRG